MENNGENRMSLQESQEKHWNLVEKMQKVLGSLMNIRINMKYKISKTKEGIEKDKLLLELERLDAEIASKSIYIKAFQQRIATMEDVVNK